MNVGLRKEGREVEDDVQYGIKVFLKKYSKGNIKLFICFII